MRRFPRYADHFESLEPRRLQAATPTPGDGHDYVMLAADRSDAKPVIRAMPERFGRTALPGGFQWFDGISNQRLGQLLPGMARISTDDRRMYVRDANGQPMVHGVAIDEANTRAMARVMAAAGTVLVLDIEHWTTEVTDGQPAVNRSIERFRQIIDWCRDEVPTLKLGLYDVVPSRSVWTAEGMRWSEDVYAATGSPWHKSNTSQAADMLAKWQAGIEFLRPVAEKVDYLFPSFYTFYDNREQWTRFARVTIESARQFGKPVIPFLWHRYHPGSQTPLKLIEPDYWAMQLDVMREYADGAVFWAYDDEAPTLNDPWVKAIAARPTEAMRRATVTNTTRSTSSLVSQAFSASSGTSTLATFGRSAISDDRDDDVLNVSSPFEKAA